MTASRTAPDRGAWLPPLRLVLLVALGGAVGTALRHGVGLALPVVDGWPWPTLAVNLTGSAALGFLLGLAERPASRVAEPVRLALGTGLLGGYTTYSSLAVEAERLLAQGSLVTAIGYVLASLVGGLLAAWAGLVLGGRRPAGASGPVDPDLEEPS